MGGGGVARMEGGRGGKEGGSNAKYSLRHVAGSKGGRYLVLGVEHARPVELLHPGRFLAAERPRAADRLPVPLLLLLLVLLLLLLLLGQLV